MANDPYAGWTQTGAANLGDIINQAAYDAERADYAARDVLFDRSYEDWRRSMLASYGLGPNDDPSQFNAVSRSSDGSQWDGQLSDSVYRVGSDDPVYTNAWDNGGRTTLGDVAKYAAIAFGGGAALNSLLAGAGAAGAAGGAGAGAAGGGATAGTAAGGLGSGLTAAETGVTALGSSWSPAALGITPVAPAITAGELAALGSGIPSLAPSITDLALKGAMRGAVTGGAKSAVQGQNPLTGALNGALGGAITGGIGGGVNALNPGGAGWVNSGITGGLTTAVAGGNPLMGAAAGSLGSLASSAGRELLTPPSTTSMGGNMDLGGVGDWFSNWSPDSLNLTTDIAGNVINTGDLIGDSWKPTFDSWVTDALMGSFGGGGGGGSWLTDAIKGAASGLGSAAGSVADAVGGGKNLAALIGAGLGAASGGGTETKTNEPWQPSQAYLKNVLGDADAALTNLRNNPFTPQQTQQYSQAFAGIDQARNALPGLLSWGQGAMQSQSTVPSYDQLFGGAAMRPAQPMQPAPTMQAGGAGGLLQPDDRLKHLMVRGGGLLSMAG